MAMVADGLRCFLVASRQNFCFRKQFFFPAAPQADSISVPRNQRFPLVVLLPLFLPALRLLPGHTPAHELKCFADANWPMSGPTSANTLAAPFSFIPGTVCSNFHRGGIPQSFDFGPDLLIQLQNRLLQKRKCSRLLIIGRWWPLSRCPSRAAIICGILGFARPCANCAISAGDALPSNR